ncbi:NB-ARC domain-containing protein [Coleofasciculus sp. E1-EBD-02]|uniref:NB-ARC domain-containing protein n=1 Tax=Coleofasciculus sp. E1-EBD-02 TaxID=3068481 RepID=UPI0032FF6D90
MTSDRQTPEQVLQSILKDIQVGGNLTTGDITQILNLLVIVKQPDSFKPTGIPHNLPRSGTVKFVGRAEALENLHEMVQQNNQVVIAAIEGMGGVGKTELATQYALLHLLLLTYPGGICWLRARDEDVGIQIVRFAQAKLSVNPPEDWDLPRQIDFCWSRWHEGNVLVVLDDVNDYPKVEPYLPPQPSRFKVLITTRLQLDLPQSLTLDVLDESVALELLREWVGTQKINHELADAKELCQRLGYLPLALNLVGRYVKKRKISLAEMLRRLEGKGLGHPSLEVIENDRTRILNIERGVAAAFELSWEQLSGNVKQLGCLLSLFALVPIPWELVESVDLEIDAEALEDARIELEDLHLLQDDKKNEDTYRLHQLIWEFFKDKLEIDNKRNQIKRQFLEAMLSQAKQILESSNFTHPHLREVMNYLLQKPSEGQDENSLIEFLDLLFRRYYSSHQYLYDTGYLENAIDKMEALKNYLKPLNEPKAKVVIGKLLGHAYYNNDRLYGKQAIDNMMAAKEIAANANQTPNEDSQMWVWYQIFLLDHVRNLRSKRPDIHPELTYENLESEIATLLPDTLEQTTTPPKPDEWFFVLRAAHYWGHRGNQVAFEVESLVSNLPGEIESQILERLSEQGIYYYSLAAILRAVNLRLSFPEQYQQSIANLLQEVPYIPDWLNTWNASLQASDNDFERFASPSQAVGDIAHQYRGIAAVQLWSYLYYVFQGNTQFELQRKLEDIHGLVDTCIELWKKADELLDHENGEQIIKYYTWIANLTVMLDLAEKYSSGEQLPNLNEEVITEVNQKLNNLENDYDLVYEAAKERSIQQVKKFYATIFKLRQTR